MSEQDLNYLRRTIVLAAQAQKRGNSAFGALLVDPDGEIILEAENTVVTDSDCTAHAETNLVREACRRFEPELLTRCTLYASTEPCAMCAAAIFMSGISRVVFALGSARYYEAHDDITDRLRLSSREVFGRATRPVAVDGPLLEDEGLAVFRSASSGSL